MICLITAIAFDDTIETKTATRLTMPYIPLGLLSLTAVLEGHGFPVEVVDLNLLLEKVLQQPQVDFCEVAAQTLAASPATVFGFSSICSSYPLTIRIAQLLRMRRPHTPILFGGPQASAVHLETLQAFPWVDIIVRGEAEVTLPELVHRLQNGQPWQDLAGISCRVGDDIRVNPDAALIADLDALPIPAYHRYHTEWFDVLPIDAGRGCPFACTFCSTNDFFRRRYRLKSPARLLQEMRFLHETYGVTAFGLTHDMFTVDKKRVRAFCQAFQVSGLTHLKWGCSARIDCVDANLLAEMAKANCTRLFFGVETGSASLQREIKKKLQTEEILPIVREASRLGIRTTTSFITGFPTETMEDLRDTLYFLMELGRLGNTSPQLHLLAPLPGTPLHQAWKHSLAFDGMYSDMSVWKWDRADTNLKLMLDYPEVFPSFYYIPTPFLDRKFLGGVRDFFLATAANFRWVTLALCEQAGDFLQVFEAWSAWLSRYRPDGTEDAEAYYFTPRFPEDFLRFVEDYCQAWDATTSSPVKALAEYEYTMFTVIEEEGKREKVCTEAQDGQQPGLTLTRDTRPLLREHIAIRTFPFDCQAVVKALQAHQPLSHIPPVRTEVVFQRQQFRKVRTHTVPPLTAHLLRFCNGCSTVENIIRALQRSAGSIERSKAEALCFAGLEALQKQGWISYTTAR